MLVAELAKLTQLHLFRRMHLILLCIVITLFAFRACKRNSLSCTRFCHGGFLHLFHVSRQLVRAKKKTPASDKQKYTNTKQATVSNGSFLGKLLPDDRPVLCLADRTPQDNLRRFDLKIESVSHHVVEFVNAEECREIPHHRYARLKRRLTVI